MKKKMLLVNADDFGMSEEITDGIIESHLNGIVTSTSLMVNMPDADRAVRLAKQIPTLDIGIHLNITEGRPILPPSKIPSLVNEEGKLLSARGLIRKFKMFRVNPKEITAEFSAQVNELHTMGIKPSHLNSHNNIHIYPLCAWAISRISKDYRINKIRADRYFLIYCKQSNAFKHKLSFYNVKTNQALKNIYKSVIKKICWNKIISADYRVAASLVFPRSNSFDFKKQWIILLSSLPKGIFEAACHPGYIGKYPFNTALYRPMMRKNELDSLVSPEIKEAIIKNNINLINFRQLK